MELTTNKIVGGISAIVFIIVIFMAYASIVPEAQTAGNELNASNSCVDAGCFFNSSHLTTDGIDCYKDNATSGFLCDQSGYVVPLGGLFGGQGVVFVIIMVALLIVIVKGLLNKK